MWSAPDALVVGRLNKNPGGKLLVKEDRTPKCAALILEERAISTATLKLEDMCVILSCHDDFKNEKRALHTVFERIGHTVHFLPTFHCELNGIERVWGHAKRYTRAHCDYKSLRTTVQAALDSVLLQAIKELYLEVHELHVCLPLKEVFLGQ